jgi:hypothetical protein
MIGVTWRRYRDKCRVPAAPVDAHRRRQLADLVDRYGVTDPRPATADVGVHAAPTVVGEPLLRRLQARVDQWIADQPRDDAAGGW